MKNNDFNNLREKLRDSVITPSSYLPTEEIKGSSHSVIYVNDKPFLGIGLSDNKETQEEGRKLLKSEAFKGIAVADFKNESVLLEVRDIEGGDLILKKEEVAISRSEIGKVEKGDEKGDLIWIVYGDNALPVATALCISPEIQDITLHNLNREDLTSFPLWKDNRIDGEYSKTFKSISDAFFDSPFWKENHLENSQSVVQCLSLFITMREEDGGLSSSYGDEEEDLERFSELLDYVHKHRGVHYPNKEETF